MKNLWTKCIPLFSLVGVIRCSSIISNEGPLQSSLSSKTSTDFEELPSSKREDDDVIVDDLCRFHGDNFLASADDLVTIDVHHELFDQSAGLVPFLSYNGNFRFLFIHCLP